MKKNRILLGACGLLIIFGGCKSKPKHTDIDKIAISDTTIKEDIKREYYMDTKFEPVITAGQETNIILTPKSADPNAMIELQTLHDKKMHIIIVKNDLSLFYHIHPSDSDEKVYTVPFTFNFGGDYIVFVDYAPINAGQQLERKEISVAGKDYAKKEYASQRLTAETEGFKVKLIPDQKELHPEHALSFTANISLNGKLIDANSLDNYLGAKAHMVIISEDTKQYLHVHPELKGKTLMLHTEFPQSGIFRGWIQFKYKEKLYTADFVFDVSASVDNQHDADDEHEHDAESTHKH